MSSAKDKKLEELYKKIRNGVVDTPWEKLIDVHAELYELLYGMKFDGKTFYSSVQDMMKHHPNIGVQFSQIASLRGGLGEEDMQELPRIMVQYNYVQAGKKDFYIYSDLVPMLRDTDLPDIQPSEMKMPFEAFSVVFKQGSIRGRGEAMNRIFVSCPDGDQMSGFLASDNDNGAPIFLTRLWKDTTLREMADAYAEVAPKAEGYQGLPRQSARDSMYLLFNLLLYINCGNADVVRDTSAADSIQKKLAQFDKTKKKTRRQKVLEQEYAKAKKRNIYLVGRSVRADDAYGVGALGEEGRKILKRFRVRGHYRNQPYGPERSLVKRKWIKPHWKGPDLAELINSGYVVKGNDQD